MAMHTGKEAGIVLSFPKTKRAPRTPAPKPLKHVQFFNGFKEDELIAIARNHRGDVIIEARVSRQLNTVEFMQRLEQWVKLLEYTNDIVSIDDF